MPSDEFQKFSLNTAQGLAGSARRAVQQHEVRLLWGAFGWLTLMYSCCAVSLAMKVCAYIQIQTRCRPLRYGRGIAPPAWPMLPMVHAQYYSNVIYYDRDDTHDHTHVLLATVRSLPLCNA